MMATEQQRAATNERNRVWREKNRARKNEQSSRYYAKKRAKRLAERTLMPAPTTKRCAMCRDEKPFDAFGVNRRRKDGLHSYCKSCCSKQRLAWNADNREKKKAFSQRHYETNRSTVLAKSAERSKRKRALDPEGVRAAARVTKRMARLKDLDRAREKDRAHRARHIETARASVRKWIMAHRSEKNAHEMARRARKHGAFIEVVNPSVVFSSANGICGICVTPIGVAEAWHVDHVIPLSKGGLHSYANTQPAHVRCNLSKGSKLVAA